MARRPKCKAVGAVPVGCGGGGGGGYDAWWSVRRVLASLTAALPLNPFPCGGGGAHRPLGPLMPSLPLPGPILTSLQPPSSPPGRCATGAPGTFPDSLLWGACGTRPRYLIVCLWRRLLASRHCTVRRSVGPNVFWLCQRSPRMTCPV